jgi:hypothetical protein
MPFVIVGDEAFRLTRNITKPYPRRDITEDKRRFNYRLSADGRCRQMVECTFGALDRDHTERLSATVSFSNPYLLSVNVTLNDRPRPAMICNFST